MSCHFHVLVCLLSLGVGPRLAAAQSPPTPPEQATAVALRVNTGESIAVDGVLDEAAWERAAPVGNFTQSEPRNGDRETERTEIRILFSTDNLYIGAQFFDSDPGAMLGNQMVRGGGLGSDDRFMWVLDPLNDRRSGYFFEINPAGAMGDAQLVPASGGSAGLAQNRAWNGIWLARVRRHVNTQFSPFVSVSNNIQYDSVSRVLGWQSRFRWITKPGNDIYFVWMTNWFDTEDRLATLDRNGAVKFLYTYRL